MDKIQLFQSKNMGQNKFEGLKSGWTVKVFQKIKEGDKTRTQAFEGLIIARKHGAEAGGTVTVSISQTQIRGIAKHKDGTETKLKTIDIKTKLG